MIKQLNKDTLGGSNLTVTDLIMNAGGETTGRVFHPDRDVIRPIDFPNLCHRLLEHCAGLMTSDTRARKSDPIWTETPKTDRFIDAPTHGILGLRN